ncbi:predicted protein [Nematostella vectensis]|uniref:Uncharacterized protein n=1 Tax=Nematostella vectensis TaxID=45351 RepID=A7SAS9_NEMVE|nr:predicted protein [Nematostella vectensis]|eukprot:XP_001631262.1 predicted protein [Nematostella vectensis]
MPMFYKPKIKPWTEEKVLVQEKLECAKETASITIPYGLQLQESLWNSDSLRLAIRVCLGSSVETFVSHHGVGKNNHINVWTLAKDNKTGEMEENLSSLTTPLRFERLLFINKRWSFVGFCNDLTLSVLTTKFAVVSSTFTGRTVLCMLYNETADELVTGIAGAIMTWTFPIKQTDPLVPGRIYNCSFTPDDWVHSLKFDSISRQIIAVSNVRIAIIAEKDYHVRTCFDKKSDFPFTTCVFYHPASYFITGDKNGTIRAWSTSLDSYPLVTQFLVRIWNFDTFTQTYRLQTGEDIVDMSLISSDQLFYYSRHNLKVWNLNQFHSLFTMLSSRIKRCFRVTSPGYPARIVVEAVDGGIRLISPVHGYELTTMLPITTLNTTEIVGFAHDRRKEKLYVLLSSREVLVFESDNNPCCAHQSWRAECPDEGVCSIALLNSEFALTEEDLDLECGLLFAGHYNGQISLLDGFGVSMKEVQAHQGQVIFLGSSHGLSTSRDTIGSRDHLLSCGTDYVIRVWQIIAVSNVRIAIIAEKDYHVRTCFDKKSDFPFTTCVFYHPASYFITGDKNGTIRAWSTSLDSYPLVTQFLVRIWNFDTFTQTYRLQTGEDIVDMSLISSDQLFYYSRHNLKVWNLNQFHSLFTMLSSRIKRCFRVTSPGYPARIVVEAVDEGIRLISPVHGYELTTMLPITTLNTTEIVGFAHDRRKEKLYVLLSSREVLVFESDNNPCCAHQLWRAECPDEGVCSIALLNSEFALTEEDLDLECGLLFAGHYNGQISLLDGFGVSMKEVQAHQGQVIFLGSSHGLSTSRDTIGSRDHLLSCGTDYVIRVWQVRHVNQRAIDIVPKSRIKLLQLPRQLEMTGNTLCMAMEDHKVVMCRTDLDCGSAYGKKKNFEFMMHSKDEGHTAAINGISSCPLLGLFATSSEDMSVRIWDMDNHLIRELNFDDTLCGVCFLNPRGDLLVGFQSHISLVTLTDYLPAPYLLKMMGLLWLISPVHGYELTTMLPITTLNTTEIVGFAHDRRKEKLYVLLSSREVLVFESDNNPCCAHQLWRAECPDEGVCSIALLNSEFALTEEDLDLECGLLFAGHYNGQISLLDGFGVSMKEVQAHQGQVIFLGSSHGLSTSRDTIGSRDHLLSCGTDYVIRVWQVRHVNQRAIDIVSKSRIKLLQLPRELEMTGNTLCMAMEDHKVVMCRTDLDCGSAYGKKKNFEFMMHSKDEGHTAAINGYWYDSHRVPTVPMDLDKRRPMLSPDIPLVPWEEESDSDEEKENALVKPEDDGLNWLRRASQRMSMMSQGGTSMLSRISIMQNAADMLDDRCTSVGGRASSLFDSALGTESQRSVSVRSHHAVDHLTNHRELQKSREEEKAACRPPLYWPCAPDCFIPNSVVRKLVKVRKPPEYLIPKIIRPVKEKKKKRKNREDDPFEAIDVRDECKQAIFEEMSDREEEEEELETKLDFGERDLNYHSTPEGPETETEPEGTPEPKQLQPRPVKLRRPRPVEGSEVLKSIVVKDWYPRTMEGVLKAEDVLNDISGVMIRCSSDVFTDLCNDIVRVNNELGLPRVQRSLIYDLLIKNTLNESAAIRRQAVRTLARLYVTSKDAALSMIRRLIDASPEVVDETKEALRTLFGVNDMEGLSNLLMSLGVVSMYLPSRDNVILTELAERLGRAKQHGMDYSGDIDWESMDTSPVMAKPARTKRTRRLPAVARRRSFPARRLPSLLDRASPSDYGAFRDELKQSRLGCKLLQQLGPISSKISSEFGKSPGSTPDDMGDSLRVKGKKLGSLDFPQDSGFARDLSPPDTPKEPASPVALPPLIFALIPSLLNKGATVQEAFDKVIHRRVDEISSDKPLMVKGVFPLAIKDIITLLPSNDEKTAIIKEKIEGSLQEMEGCGIGVRADQGFEEKFIDVDKMLEIFALFESLDDQKKIFKKVVAKLMGSVNRMDRLRHLRRTGKKEKSKMGMSLSSPGRLQKLSESSNVVYPGMKEPKQIAGDTHAISQDDDEYEEREDRFVLLSTPVRKNLVPGICGERLSTH